MSDNAIKSVLISYSLGDAIDWKQLSIVRQPRISVCLLLARGRDRLETLDKQALIRHFVCLLLARGRDRLETSMRSRIDNLKSDISYSLGDAIDWKHDLAIAKPVILILISYSLGDAIDWKLTSPKNW